MDYRDIHPSNTVETLYTCIACFAGFFFIGQVIGQLTSIIFNMDKVKSLRSQEYHTAFYCIAWQEANDFQERIENFNQYAHSQGIPHFLLERVRQYFDFQFECTRGMDVDIIFSNLPHSLRTRLFYDLYGDKLKKLSIFAALDQGVIISLLNVILHIILIFAFS